VHELPYAAAKAGLNVLTEGMAQAFGPKVRVNCIQPGPFRTDISRAWSAGTVAEMERRLALRRIGEPHEVVGAALYLASPSASFCTGAVLRVDGGVR
jgi:NAD(P)-dependent dehydrogenase (short-subunit alcohol dehydrogenase family)